MSTRALPPRSAPRLLRRLAAPAVVSLSALLAAAGFANDPTANDTAGWKALVERAEQAAEERRWEDARSLLLSALARDDAEPGIGRGDRAGALSNLAVVHHVLGELDLADDAAKRAYRLAQSGVIPDLGVMGQARHTRGNVAADRGRPNEAVGHYQRALIMLEEAVGPEHPDVAATVSNLGRVYMDLNRPEKAVPLLARARAIRQKVPTSDPLAVARLDLDLAYAYAMQSDAKRAAEHYAEALPALERWSAPSVDLALAFQNAAVQSRKLARTEEAERLLSRSVVVLEAELGGDDPRVANALYGVAVLAYDREDYPRARSLFARCAEIWERGAEPRDERLKTVRALIAEIDAALPPVAAGEPSAAR